MTRSQQPLSCCRAWLIQSYPLVNLYNVHTKLSEFVLAAQPYSGKPRGAFAHEGERQEGMCRQLLQPLAARLCSNCRKACVQWCVHCSVKPEHITHRHQQINTTWMANNNAPATSLYLDSAVDAFPPLAVKNVRVMHAVKSKQPSAAS
jgi:hypothetical protein